MTEPESYWRLRTRLPSSVKWKLVESSIAVRNSFSWEPSQYILVDPSGPTDRVLLLSV